MSEPLSVFWWRWLLFANGALLAFGLALIFLPGPMLGYLNVLFFGSPALPPAFSEQAAGYIVFIYGVMGGILAGWSVTMLYLTRQLRRGDRAAWWAMLFSALIWFGLDSGASVATGYPANVLQNAVFLVLYAVPLAVTYRRLPAA
ncbi:MAG: hypothetical protein MUE40_00410 [Anaerolineae bacterium]|jgi:hypothetical protein|nr:hypothetical protein [Anaerolineae bacterium]